MTPPVRPSRRSVLETVGGGLTATLAGCIGGRNGRPSDGNDDESAETGRETYPLMEGTAYETAVHVLTAGNGPTGMVLGGVHGNEVGGVEAAHVATEYDLVAGRLVVIPEANKPAVDEGTRNGPDGNLNRQFPIGEEPTTEIARALWAEIEEYDPDCLIDMHTSRGILRVDEGAVGQTVFSSPAEGSSEAAETAVEYMNKEVMADFLEEHPEYAFRAARVEDEDIQQSDQAHLMAAMKAGSDLGTKGWITEVTYRGLDVDQQAFLHDRLAIRLLAENEIEVESPLDGESLQSL
ncbi:succinylglutamate desuccinylase / aspartoacylase family protein [Halalkalicoccus paucihalophilus]|uniref:Succinylglutamate desuccinylase / aspartoacylase family protein n=1 Tax=Halalkalicoccus paucihalophilus TaxID=1008153 RepID=A0A151AFY8_9EURY|nr:succinylglutamate desuccinylase/aspartoacylase family protein [Halalkalicoccus paucihalophilus]KYH26307.1 succinylglutamate desuccinylase / aspartoacylase family protein [Halalkalicoccus paucihalophilus]